MKSLFTEGSLYDILKFLEQTTIVQNCWISFSLEWSGGNPITQIRALATIGAKFTQKDFLKAIEQRHLEVLKFILELYPEAIDPNGLVYAVRNDFIPEAKLLIESKVGIACSEDLFAIAAKKRNIKIAQLIYDNRKLFSVNTIPEGAYFYEVYEARAGIFLNRNTWINWIAEDQIEKLTKTIKLGAKIPEDLLDLVIGYGTNNMLHGILKLNRNEIKRSTIRKATVEQIKILQDYGIEISSRYKLERIAEGETEYVETLLKGSENYFTGHFTPEKAQEICDAFKARGYNVSYGSIGPTGETGPVGTFKNIDTVGNTRNSGNIGVTAQPNTQFHVHR